MPFFDLRVESSRQKLVGNLKKYLYSYLLIAKKEVAGIGFINQRKNLIEVESLKTIAGI